MSSARPRNTWYGRGKMSLPDSTTALSQTKPRISITTIGEITRFQFLIPSVPSDTLLYSNRPEQSLYRYNPQTWLFLLTRHFLFRASQFPENPPFGVRG